MKIIVAPSGKQHSFRTAEALWNKGRLFKYITTIYDKPWSLTRLVKHLLHGDLRKKCASHRDNNLPDGKVAQFCEWEALLRLFLSKFPSIYKHFPHIYDWLHDRFGRRVAHYAIRNNVDAVIMYDTNANECFRILKEKAPHIKRILDVSIANRIWMKQNYIKDIESTHDDGLRKEQVFLWDETNIKRYAEEFELSQYFLVGSDMVKRSLMYNGVKENQVWLARYGVDVSKFKFIQKAEITMPLKLLFVGQVNYRKGMHHLLKVISQFPQKQVELYLAGAYDTNATFYTEYKGKDNIHFLGFVTRDILASLYQECHVFVFPTLGEGYAMVLLEALSCGMPCIVSNHAGGNEAIIDGKNGFEFPAGNDEALREKIQWFIDNPKELPRMSIESRKSVEHQTWEDYYRMVNDAIDNMIDK